MRLSSTTPRLVVTSASTFRNRAEVSEMNTTLNSLAELREREGDRVEIGASLYKEPVSKKVKNLLPALGLVTGGTALLGTLGVLAGGLSPALAVGLAVAVPAAMLGAHVTGEVMKDRTQGDSVPSGVSVQHSGLQIDFDNLTSRSSSEEALRETAIANLKAYPNALHVVHLNGHGHGATRVAGIEGHRANAALQQATVKAGRRFDVAVYESCLNANYEQLRTAANSADYAVAFEDLVPKSNSKVGRIPLTEMLSEATRSASAEEAAKSMAKSAGALFETGESVPVAGLPWARRADKANREALWTNPDTTAAAFDLRAMREKLDPALDGLGRKLSDTLSQDSHLRDLAKKAQRDNYLEKSGDLIDLGGFLTQVREGASKHPELEKSIDRAFEALNQTTLYLRTGHELPMSGLSFHTETVADTPEGWAGFVERYLR